MLEAPSCLQLLLHIAEKEGAIDLCHLEEEGEDIKEGGSRKVVGKVLNLFTRGKDTSLLQYCIYTQGERHGAVCRRNRK